MTATILTPGSTEERLFPGDFGLSFFILLTSPSRQKSRSYRRQQSTGTIRAEGIPGRPAAQRSVFSLVISACPFSSFLLPLAGKKADHTGGSSPQERSERKGSHDCPAPWRRMTGPATIQLLNRIGDTNENTGYLQPRYGRRPDDVPAATRHAQKIPPPIERIRQALEQKGHHRRHGGQRKGYPESHSKRYERRAGCAKLSIRD